MVSIILSSQLISQDELNSIKNKFLSASQQKPAPHHNYYHSNFNAVDIHDGFWNKLQNHHSVRNWKSKMILALLDIGLVNSWSIYNSFKSITLMEFYENIAKVTTNPNFSIE